MPFPRFPRPRLARVAWRLAVAAAGVGLAVLLLRPDAGAADPTVILISLDGTHPADLDATELPALSRIAREGTRAERMIPEFPSNTFPNHVTLVTGVSPERHGIVNNVFVDPERGRYDYEADPTWLEAEPLWSIVEGHGVLSAAYYWIGSEGPWRSGRGPRYWQPFSSRTGEAEKVDAILAWLALPEAQRPHLVTSWFRGADGAAHRHGPRSPEALESLREQDAQLARLLSALDARGWSETTLIVVSDHGMQAVEASVDLDSALEAAGITARIHGGGGFVTVTLEHPERDVGRAVSVARGLGLEAWPRGQGPPGTETRHPRFGDLVALAPPGTKISRSGWIGRLRSALMGGVHGYRPGEPAMAAIFLAMGRGVERGRPLGEVRTRDVAPTVLALLGLPIPETMEGRPIVLAGRPQPEEADR